jgi:class 3 adenylate cyclase/PAS domain-containing protein
MTAAEEQVELARRTAMLGAIGYAATQIVAAADWRAGIQELLSRLGLATGVSRVTLFEAHTGPEGRLVESCRYDWAEEGLATLSDDERYQSMPLSDEDRSGELGDWARRRERGEVVQATLGEVRGYTREVFLEQGTLSFASVPIMAGGRFWGFLGFDDCKVERIWSPLEIEVLKTAAALIAGAIARAQAHDQLLLSEERYKMAALGANDGLWDWDLASGKAYLSPRLHELLHLEEGVLAGDMGSLLRMLDPADAEALQGYLARRFARGKQKFEFECRVPQPGRGPLWIILRGLIVYRNGYPARIVGSLRDITDRKEAQALLVEAERKRSNLARYFSPNMVDELMQSGGDLDKARTQIVTILFVDLIGFTTLSAQLSGVEVIELLRECLSFFEEAVFAHEGTVDKYLGDGLMATFGTPRPGPKDAGNALACARHMAAKTVAWNTERIAQGLQPLHVGIGLHHGEAVLGDIGGERRLEFAVLGDTVNVARRIEEMTRSLDIAILASDAVIEAVRREGGTAILAPFEDFGLHALRGRAGRIRLWGCAAEPAAADRTSVRRGRSAAGGGP